MAKSKRLVGATIAIIIVAALAAGVYFRISSDASAAPAGVDGAGAGAPTPGFSTDVAIAVEGTEVQLDTLVLSVTASGQAEAWRRTLITAEVGGRIAGISARESQRVGAGAVLLTLDPVDKQLALEDAQAQLARAEASYRAQILFDANLSEEVRRERDRAARLKEGVDQAEIAVKRARLDLERTRVRAPFPGRVASLKVVTGELVSNGTELMTLVDIDPIRLQVQVLEGELAHLAPGGNAEVRFSAFPDEVFLGEIESINPVVEQETRTARVTVLVPNPGGRVLPGMYARVRLEAQRIPDRILVPRSAILERDRRTMLFVHEAGKAKWRYVTTGLENDELVEIVASAETEMVEPGEVVLTGGHFTLTHDASVRLVDDYRRSDAGRPQ